MTEDVWDYGERVDIGKPDDLAEIVYRTVEDH